MTSTNTSGSRRSPARVAVASNGSHARTSQTDTVSLALVDDDDAAQQSRSSRSMSHHPPSASGGRQAGEAHRGDPSATSSSGSTTTATTTASGSSRSSGNPGGAAAAMAVAPQGSRRGPTPSSHHTPSSLYDPPNNQQAASSHRSVASSAAGGSEAAARQRPAGQTPSLTKTPQSAERRAAGPPASTRHSAPSASPYSEADVARVRAALADAGYPNPSWSDIERVFAQMARNATPPAATGLEGNDVSRLEHHDKGNDYDDGGDEDNDNGVPRDALGYAYPTSTDTTGLLRYLAPSKRLERFIQLRERELESMCLRGPSVSPATHTTAPSKAAIMTPPSAAPLPPTSPPATAGAPAPPLPRRGPPAEPRTSHTVPAMAAQHRRAANIVYNMTGDQRFRFFPSTRTPQGCGTLLASAPRRTRAAHPQHDDNDAPARAAPREHQAAAAAPHTAASLTPCLNYYNAERRALGGRGAAQSRQGGRVLSGNCVSYLDPEGCTLRRKADPVRRYQQMRTLWERDAFLTQRRRPQEAWRTRQITLSYEGESQTL